MAELGVFTYRDAVAVVQMVCFAIFLGFGLLLCSRHGFSRSSGWLILLTFSVLRLLASSFQLATINFPSRSVYGGALICQSIGLSPLTVLNLGLLSRVNRFVNIISKKTFTILTITSLTAVALAIHGGSKAARSYGSNVTELESNTEMRVAVVLFTACYLAACLMWCGLLRQWSVIPQPEHKALICFALCAPFIAVRLLYSLIGDFSNDIRFSPLFGDVTLFLVMSVLMEIIAVLICVATGLHLRILPKEMLEPGHSQNSNMPMRRR